MTTRREFIGTAGFAAAAALTGNAAAPATDRYAASQADIDLLTPQAYADYMRGKGDPGDGAAAIARLDAAFDKIMFELKSVSVTSRPAVWLMYNMGIVVKTPRTCFAVDLVHRRAEEMAGLLDFALITHNHGDHFTEKFYREMNGAGKTVISNFKDNYGVADWKKGGYTRSRKEFKIEDVTIDTSLTDHNWYLVDYTTVFEIRVGNFVIYHSGDCSNVEKLNPKRSKPDLWVVHPRDGMPILAGMKKFRPKLTAIAHLNELGHGEKWPRVTWKDGLAEAEKARQAGFKSVVPLWGDRIV